MRKHSLEHTHCTTTHITAPSCMLKILHNGFSFFSVPLGLHRGCKQSIKASQGPSAEHRVMSTTLTAGGNSITPPSPLAKVHVCDVPHHRCENHITVALAVDVTTKAEDMVVLGQPTRLATRQ